MSDEARQMARGFALLPQYLRGTMYGKSLDEAIKVIEHGQRTVAERLATVKWSALELVHGNPEYGADAGRIFEKQVTLLEESRRELAVAFARFGDLLAVAEADRPGWMEEPFPALQDGVRAPSDIEIERWAEEVAA
jgi:hypothetical protein